MLLWQKLEIKKHLTKIKNNKFRQLLRKRSGRIKSWNPMNQAMKKIIDNRKPAITQGRVWRALIRRWAIQMLILLLEEMDWVLQLDNLVCLSWFTESSTTNHYSTLTTKVNQAASKSLAKTKKNPLTKNRSKSSSEMTLMSRYLSYLIIWSQSRC